MPSEGGHVNAPVHGSYAGEPADYKVACLPTDRLPTTAILRCLGDGILINVPAKISRLDYICEDKSPPLLEKKKVGVRRKGYVQGRVSNVNYVIV